ncbi:MAG: hypothetical protein Q9219_007300 [cf. Caloplaca sp. 3 TL-2023]
MYEDPELTTQPQQTSNEFQRQSLHPDLSVLVRTFTDNPPPRPYTMSSTIMPANPDNNRCQNPRCPLQLPHSTGLYLHMNQPSQFASQRPHFGASNPPPQIWEARARILNDRGLMTDFEAVVGFISAHYVAWTDTQKQAYQQSGYASAVQGNQQGSCSTEMQDLVKGVTNVHLENYINMHCYAQNEFRPSGCSPRTQARLDAEMEREMCQVLLDLDLKDAQDATARMDITDEEEKENVDPANKL